MQATCFVCAGNLALFGPCQGYRYYCCGACDTLQLWPMPSPAELEALYKEKYVEENEAEAAYSPEYWKNASENYRKAILEMVTRHRITGPLVDFGAGYGFLVEALREIGIPSSGLEL